MGRFLQILDGRFLCFALIFLGSPQNSCRFDPINYHLTALIWVKLLRYTLAIRRGFPSQQTTGILIFIILPVSPPVSQELVDISPIYQIGTANFIRW